MVHCLIVGIGGFIGAVLRYLITLIPMKENTLFPYKTFAVNILGAFAIAVIAILYSKMKKPNAELLLFLKVGICGGFTTFSSFALETFDLLKLGATIQAAVYVILSVVISLLVIYGIQSLLQ
ncbi:MAG: fluoride efflux transporter CrcB [Treponemataceae bacterium]